MNINCINCNVLINVSAIQYKCQCGWQHELWTNQRYVKSVLLSAGIFIDMYYNEQGEFDLFKVRLRDDDFAIFYANSYHSLNQVKSFLNLKLFF